MGEMDRILSAALVAVVAFASIASAHEHHDDKIQEGQFVSDDPIVCQNQSLIQT
jgi:hypothetical protein